MIKIISLPDLGFTDRWNDLITHSSDTVSYFQTPACFDFYRSLDFITPFVKGVCEEGSLKGVVCGYVIAEGNGLKKRMTRRAIVPGGALLDKDISAKALKILLAALKTELAKQGVIYLELRNYNDYSGYKDIFEKSGYQYLSHLNFHVSTPDVNTTLMNLNSTKRRDVRYAQKKGAMWELSSSEQEMQDYYTILNDLYKIKIKTPLFPPEFFYQLIKTKQGRFFVVKYEDKVIGGSVCVELEGKILYEWFVCGLDGQYKNLYPSTVATWAAIEYAASHDLYRFDMMGAGKPDEGYGVREFKSKFGGELVENGRFLCVINPILYFIGKTAVRYLKKNKKR